MPAHIGVKGNEVADQVARASLKKQNVAFNMAVGKMECCGLVKLRTNEQWQGIWVTEIKGRHLYSIVQGVSQNPVCFLSRQDEIILVSCSPCVYLTQFSSKPIENMR